MKLTQKLHLFFKSRIYRKLLYLYIKESALYYVKIPFVSIKTLYDITKIYINYQGGWERYIKLNEMQSKYKQKNSLATKAGVYFNFTIAFYNLCIALYLHSMYNKIGNVEQKDYKVKEFVYLKEECINYLSRLKVVEVTIPKDVEQFIKTTNIESFEEPKEIIKKCNYLSKLVDEIKVK